MKATPTIKPAKPISLCRSFVEPMQAMIPSNKLVNQGSQKIVHANDEKRSGSPNPKLLQNCEQDMYHGMVSTNIVADADPNPIWWFID